MQGSGMSNLAALTEGYFETADDKLESQVISRVSPENVSEVPECSCT